MWFMWKCWSVCGVYMSHQAFDPSGLCGNVGLCVVCTGLIRHLIQAVYVEMLVYVCCVHVSSGI